MKLAIATTASDAFALPSTVMMRSAVDSLVGKHFLDIFVLDCGMTSRSRQKMKKSIPGSWAKVHFIPIDTTEFSKYREDAYFSLNTYARLSLAQVLPPELPRILYVDGDMLFICDIAQLWEMDLHGHLVGAVQDPVAGIVGKSPQMMHWQEWDVPAGTPIFNAGLMLLDMEKCREVHLFDQAVQIAREYPERMRWHDQDALNHVVGGQFEPLDLAWNVMPHLYYPPHCSEVVFEKSQVDYAIGHAKALHFSGGNRPWKGPGRHWREAEFYRYLYRTAWRCDVDCAPWMGTGNTAWTKAKYMLKPLLRNWMGDRKYDG